MEYKVFVIQIVALSINLDNEMHPLRKAQIAYQKMDEASIEVLSKYVNFANVFLLKLAVELLKYIRINNHTIKLIDD